MVQCAGYEYDENLLELLRKNSAQVGIPPDLANTVLEKLEMHDTEALIHACYDSCMK